MIWSEGDCQFQLALDLESQFPGMVHLEVPVARYNARPWDKETDKTQFVDIVVSDLSGFDVKRDVFAGHQHALFVEVKYVGHSSKFKAQSLRTITSGVKNDLERLKRNLERPRCTAAAMLLIDDNSHLEHFETAPGNPGSGHCSRVLRSWPADRSARTRYHASTLMSDMRIAAGRTNRQRALLTRAPRCRRTMRSPSSAARLANSSTRSTAASIETPPSFT